MRDHCYWTGMGSWVDRMAVFEAVAKQGAVVRAEETGQVLSPLRIERRLKIRQGDGRQGGRGLRQGGVLAYEKGCKLDLQTLGTHASLRTDREGWGQWDICMSGAALKHVDRKLHDKPSKGHGRNKRAASHAERSRLLNGRLLSHSPASRHGWLRI